MNIELVKTAIKMGEFRLREDGHQNKIKIEYLPSIPKKTLTGEAARIYLFAVDRIIKKIGGSSGKGGIKNTMNFYTSAMTGSPGVPRFVIHLLIENELKKGKEVGLYMITSPKVIATVNGLFGPKEIKIASFKEMEDLCKSDYYSVEKCYPDWNFQENYQPYPEELAQKHNEYHKNRLKNKAVSQSLGGQ